MAAIFDLPITPTSESIYNSSTVLLDPEIVEVAAGISLQSCIQADIYDIAYVLPVNGSHLWFTSHPDVGEYSNMCHRVTGPQKMLVAVGNLVISRSNHDILITSGLTAAILLLVGVAWHFSVSETSELMCLWFPTDWWKPHRRIPIRFEEFQSVSEIQAGAAFAPPPLT